MSAYYRCAVTVEGIQEEKILPIANAIKAFWGCFDGSDIDLSHGKSGNMIQATGEGNISDPIAIFSQNLAIAVWKANQDKCEVTVDTVYMDELPTDSFHFDESAYIKIMAKV